MESFRTLSPGTKVVTGELIQIGCSCINEKHMLARKPGMRGTVVGPVFGCCDEVWWIQYDEDSQVGAYDLRELILSP